MKNENSTEMKEKRLNTFLGFDYMIGLIITVIFIITGFFTRNDSFYRLSIIFLIITPAAGLLITLIYHIIRRNTKSILITIAVLLILAASALIGLLNFN